MKRHPFPVLVMLGVCAAWALSACSSETGSGTPATTADAAGQDTTGGETAAEGKDVPSDTSAPGGDTIGGTPDGTVADVAVAPDTASLPCDGKCAEAKCDKATNKCKLPCDGLCKADEFCKVAGATETCTKQTCKDPTFTDHIQKLAKIEISGKGEGCDVNEDGKIDNALGGALKQLNFLGQANDKLVESIADATLVLLLEASKYDITGGKFDMNLLIGDAEDPDKCADHTKGGCSYTVTKASYDFTSPVAGFCPALVNFADCAITDKKLVAGGKDQKFALTFPIQDIPLSLTISQARLEGVVSDDKTWVDTKTGQICGVIAKEDLDKAVDLIPDETIAGLGIGDKTAVKGLLNTLLKPDIDTDADDKADSISVALKFESVKALVSGFTVKK